MLLLFACVAPPSAEPPSAEALAALAGDLDALPERAVPHDDAGVSLWDGGAPWIADAETGWSRGEYPVVETGADVRIAVLEDGVRYLVWVPRDGLVDRMARSTWVDAAGRPVRDDGPGVRVPGGTPIEVRVDGSFARFHGYFADAEVRVDDALVDQVALGDDEDDHARLAFDGDTPIRGGATLTDDDGAPLVTLDRGGSRESAVVTGRTLEEEEDRVLVEVELGRSRCGADVWLARGWVDRAELEVHGFTGYGGGCCGLFLMRGASFGLYTLPPDTWLHDAPEGAPVAVTTAEVAVLPADDGGERPGWSLVSLATPWGRGELWVEADVEALRTD